MIRFRAGIYLRLPVMAVLVVLACAGLGNAQEFQTYYSDEYGFSMKYPANWKKIDKPKGNYYVVFQAPEMTDSFRNRIHVAAHKPVKDTLQVFLQELRNGIADLQKKSGTGDKQLVRIMDEGEFRCEVPGAYFFFIQAYEDKLKLWMDIVIVFYKHQDTLLRISCLAPATAMDKLHELFNTVLVSVKVDEGPAGPPPAAASRPGVPLPPGAGQPPAMAPTGPQQPLQQAMPPSPPATGRRPETLPGGQPAQPSVTPEAQPSEQDTRPAPGLMGPGRTPPRGGPMRQPERPPTGIVN